MKNRLWEMNWRKSELSGGCNPVVWGDDIVLHDGKGEGIGEYSDDIGYYETMLTGDFTLSTKLLESERAYYGTAISTGIMLRDGVEGDDKMLYFGLASDGEYHVNVRGEKGGASREIEIAHFSQTEHRWMKLKRTDDTVICSVSRDGVEFETVAEVKCGFSQTVHVGFTSAFKSVYGSVTLQ